MARSAPCTSEGGSARRRFQASLHEFLVKSEQPAQVTIVQMMKTIRNCRIHVNHVFCIPISLSVLGKFYFGLINLNIRLAG